MVAMNKSEKRGNTRKCRQKTEGRRKMKQGAGEGRAVTAWSEAARHGQVDGEGDSLSITVMTA